MILNIRGTNGSGKSTLVRQVMEKFLHRAVYGVLGPKRPEAHCLTVSNDKFIYVLGPYHIPSGGVDNVQPYESIPLLIEKYAAKGHVIFEGILVSMSKGQVGICLEQWGKQSVLLFLDTSVEECIASVHRRRGDDKESKHLAKHYEAILRVRNNLLEEDKLRVLDVSRENGLQTILTLLQEKT